MKMADRLTMPEIRERTYKPKDAWWTVLLVDPVAGPLVRLVAPYRWITPDLLTIVATIIGIASTVCFALGGRWWIVAGALLFHLSFIVDCMDGKIARLNGTGSLFGGQYARTHEPIYLWLSTIVIFLDLFRYLNGGQIGKYNRQMSTQLAEARGLPTAPAPGPESDPENESEEPATTSGPTSLPGRVIAAMRRHRIRPHLVSGIEFEMFVFIIGPLTGWVIGTTIVSGVLLLAFEFLLTLRLWLATRRFPARLAKAEAEGRNIKETIAF